MGRSSSRDADNGKKHADVGRPNKRSKGLKGNTQGSNMNLDEERSGEVTKSTTANRKISIATVQSRQSESDDDNSKALANTTTVRPPQTLSMGRRKHVSVCVVESREPMIEDDGATTRAVIVPRAAEPTESNRASLQQPAARTLNPVESYLQMRLDQAGTTNFENEKRAVQRFVRETVFSKVKFITSDVELDYSGMSPSVFATSYD
jgi:hypothetical protein